MRYGKETIKWALSVGDHIDAEEIGDELDYVYSKADSLDRALRYIESERWNLAEDLIGEDDEDVRRQILTELAVLQRITDVMEAGNDVV